MPRCLYFADALFGPRPVRLIFCIRQRAFGGDASYNLQEGLTKDEFRQVLKDERGRELCFEMLRHFDLIRWGIIGDALDLPAVHETKANQGEHAYVACDNFQSGKHELFPIPLDEIQANRYLENTNNPNY